MYLFIATIALGSVNLLFHVRRVRHRTSLIVMHALAAVSGVLTLIYATWLHVAGAAVPPPPVEVPAAPIPAPPPPPPAPLPVALATTAVDPSGAAIDAALWPSARWALAEPIQFDSGGTQIPSSSLRRVRDIARTLQEHAEIALVEVQGYSDRRGGGARHLELSRRRADAVVAALVGQGVGAQRLHGAGYGGLCPADPACAVEPAPEACAEPDHERRDRRVVLVPLRVGPAALRGSVVCDRAAA